MTPKSRAARALREAVLGMASTVPAMRALVNSGRLSVPTWLTSSPLNTADVDAFSGWMVPGAPMDDAPVTLKNGSSAWLLRVIPTGFALLHAGPMNEALRAACAALHITPLLVGDDLMDRDDLVTQRYDLQPGTAYLIRPDQHVTARWRHTTPEPLAAALQRATQ